MTDTFACLIAGEQYTGGFTLSFHTDTALPHQ